MWQKREVSYYSRGRHVRHELQVRAAFAQDLNCLTVRATHYIFYLAESLVFDSG